MAARGESRMKCVLVGSRFFGASVLEALRKEEGLEFTSIVVPAADDRLALAAQGGRACRCTCSRTRRSFPAKRSPKAPISSSPRTRTRASATRRWRDRAMAASAITRRSCRAIAASPPSNGRSSKATRSPAARSITSPTAGTPAPSRRRTGASSARASRHASCGSARWRRWACSCSPRSCARCATPTSCRPTHRTRASPPARRCFAAPSC